MSQAEAQRFFNQHVRFSLLPLTTEFVRSHLTSEQEQVLRERLLDYYTSFVSQHSMRSGSPTILMHIERANILTLTDTLIANNRFQALAKIISSYYPFLSRQGHWSRGTYLLSVLLEWAKKKQEQFWIARCNHWLGRQALYRGDHETAQQRMEKASAVYEQGIWQWFSVRTYLAQSLFHQGQLQEAKKVLEEALPLALETETYHRGVRILNAFAEISLAEDDLMVAQAHIEHGYKLAFGRNTETTIMGRNCYLRGLLELRRGHTAEAEEWLNQYHVMAKREGFVQERAIAELALARVAQANSDEHQLLDYASSAADVFDRLGMKKEHQDCLQLLTFAS